MIVFRKFASLTVIFALVSMLLVVPSTQAQEMSDPVVCDSTLVTLLLVAEYNYDYLSNMMTMDGGHAPNVELGQYKPLIDDIIAMMTSMHGDMSDEDMQMMATEEAQTMDMMSMSDEDLMKMWMDDMNMTDDMSMMTMLAPGDVAGEDPACTALRADVQHFLLVHIIADTMHGSM